jgi:hypothetical protein
MLKHFGEKLALEPKVTAIVLLLFKEPAFKAAIQRRGSVLAWIVILSVYGPETIAIDLSLSPLIF